MKLNEPRRRPHPRHRCRTTSWSRLAAVLTALTMALVAGACAGAEDAAIDATGIGDHSKDIAAEVASYDLVAARPGRFIVGLFAADRQRLVGYGTVELAFRYLGPRGQQLDPPREGPTARASFLPIPGQAADQPGSSPRFVHGSEIIGVYGAEPVAFAEPGFWEVEVTADIDGEKRTTTSAFEVLADSDIPAPGDLAPLTRQPLAGDDHVPAKAIDSRAGGGESVPDPDLHNETVADAVAAHRPIMVVISTPTYCQSRFCGPITDSVQALASEYGNDEMAFVHLEIWRDFEAKQLNPEVSDWIAPTGTEDAREPWVFTVGRDGRIVERFDNVATDAELEAAVQRLLRP